MPGTLAARARQETMEKYESSPAPTLRCGWMPAPRPILRDTMAKVAPTKIEATAARSVTVSRHGGRPAMRSWISRSCSSSAAPPSSAVRLHDCAMLSDLRQQRGVAGGRAGRLPSLRAAPPAPSP